MTTEEGVEATAMNAAKTGMKHAGPNARHRDEVESPGAALESGLTTGDPRRLGHPEEARAFIDDEYSWLREVDEQRADRQRHLPSLRRAPLLILVEVTDADRTGCTYDTAIQPDEELVKGSRRRPAWRTPSRTRLPAGCSSRMRAARPALACHLLRRTSTVPQPKLADQNQNFSTSCPSGTE